MARQPLPDVQGGQAASTVVQPDQAINKAGILDVFDPNAIAKGRVQAVKDANDEAGRTSLLKYEKDVNSILESGITETAKKTRLAKLKSRYAASVPAFKEDFEGIRSTAVGGLSAAALKQDDQRRLDLQNAGAELDPNASSSDVDSLWLESQTNINKLKSTDLSTRADGVYGTLLNNLDSTYLAFAAKLAADPNNPELLKQANDAFIAYESAGTQASDAASILGTERQLQNHKNFQAELTRKRALLSGKELGTMLDDAQKVESAQAVDVIMSTLDPGEQTVFNAMMDNNFGNLVNNTAFMGKFQTVATNLATNISKASRSGKLDVARDPEVQRAQSSVAVMSAFFKKDAVGGAYDKARLQANPMEAMKDATDIVAADTKVSTAVRQEAVDASGQTVTDNLGNPDTDSSKAPAAFDAALELAERDNLSTEGLTDAARGLLDQAHGEFRKLVSDPVVKEYIADGKIELVVNAKTGLVELQMNERFPTGGGRSFQAKYSNARNIVGTSYGRIAKWMNTLIKNNPERAEEFYETYDIRRPATDKPEATKSQETSPAPKVTTADEVKQDPNLQKVVTEVQKARAALGRDITMQDVGKLMKKLGLNENTPSTAELLKDLEGILPLVNEGE